MCFDLPTGEEFYRQFRSQYWEFPKIVKSVPKPGESRRGPKMRDTRWTHIMLDKDEGFFAHLAQRMGCEVAREKLRIDQLWREGRRNVVALDHENWYTGIDRELENLSAVEAPLRVLVTYVRDKEHVWRPFELAEQVKKHLEEKGDRNDFLLVVGNKQANEWVAFKFFPEALYRIDVIPPPTKGLRRK